eukprot:CAMPEP_0204375972 /NCGR_PEP_ID=MMETSP0469-20131031/49683_1 /ASSEMBLY_ACC=CAM_ASM_000384 /TAXON_ID=2969 /ORGANISM="Oxyrrhis marina" /LENGTH=70 /DNA_ID=CAMNT_0051366751 /DNA_START=57 /DNA_END=269 /DNA_ORIENTATION=+
MSIVFTSCLVGSIVPLVFLRVGVDPAHAGAAIQVLMDISGVTITCVVCSVILHGHEALAHGKHAGVAGVT